MNFIKALAFFAVAALAAPLPKVNIEKRAIETVTNTVVVTTVIAHGYGSQFQQAVAAPTVESSQQAPAPTKTVAPAVTYLIPPVTTPEVIEVSTSNDVATEQVTSDIPMTTAESTTDNANTSPNVVIVTVTETPSGAYTSAYETPVVTSESVASPSVYLSTAPSVSKSTEVASSLESSTDDATSDIVSSLVDSIVAGSTDESSSSDVVDAQLSEQSAAPTVSGSHLQTPPPDDGHKSYYDHTMYDPVAEGLQPLSSGGNGGYRSIQGGCAFPWSSGNSDHVVPITPGSMNKGWAMSPDTACLPGMWCPYACESGYYSTQWDPKSAKQEFSSLSMHGGLYCDMSGNLWVPNSGEAFCQAGAMNTFIRNQLGESVAACQTVYPGSEAMIIPTVAGPGQTKVMNIVPPNYWCNTSSDFYVQLAGSDDAQCIWGDESKPVGNWGPYIFGGRLDDGGNTYISLRNNPLYESRGFTSDKRYNVRIECSKDGGCDFPSGGECKCENGNCSLQNGCTVAVKPGFSAYYVLY